MRLGTRLSCFHHDEARPLTIKPPYRKSGMESWHAIEIGAGITLITGMGSAHWPCWVGSLATDFFHIPWFHREIVQKHPTWLDMRREINYSILSIIIFGCVGILTIVASRYGMTQLHWKIQDRGWPGFGSSILLTVFYMTLTFTEHTVSCIISVFSDGCITCTISRGTQYPGLPFPLPLGKLLFNLGCFLWLPFCIQSNLLHSECSWDGKYWIRALVIPGVSFIQSNECPTCLDPSSIPQPIRSCIMKTQREIKAFISIFGIASWLQTCLIGKNVLLNTPQIPNQKAKQLRPLSLIRNNDWPFKSLNCLII